MDLTFKGVWRMDWGFGNPNLTAFFITTLAIGIWILPFLFRRGFWISLPICTILSVCLAHTMSRGGAIGFAFGLGLLLLFIPRPWPQNRIIAAIAALCLSAVLIHSLSVYQRYAEGILSEDKSIANRLAIWKTAPAMYVDAPSGWGIGRAGKAYMNWYQSVDRQESYESLINTHLTKLIELGFAGGILYLLLWGWAFLICLPSPIATWRAIPFCILAMAFITSNFTNMAQNFFLWLLPGIGLFASAISRLIRVEFISRKQWLLGSLPAFLLTGLLASLGWTNEDRDTIRACKSWTIWNGAKSTTWVVANTPLLGNRIGHIIRSQWNAGPLGVSSSTNDLTNEVDVLILAGELPSDFSNLLVRIQPTHLILLNPAGHPQSLATFKGKVNILIGEFSRRANPKIWESSGTVQIIPDAGDFLPSWPNNVMSICAEKSPN